MCLEPLDFQFLVCTFVFNVFDIYPVISPLEFAFVTFRAFLEIFLLEFFAKLLDPLCHLFCIALAVKTIAFVDVAENVLLCDAFLGAVLADRLCVEIGLCKILALVQDADFQLFRGTVSCHVQITVNLVVIGHGQDFCMTQSDFAVAKHLQGFFSEVRHLDSADYPTRVTPEMACNRVNVHAVFDHLCNGQTFVNLAHVLAAHVFCGGDFKSFFVLERSDFALDALESKILQCVETPAASDYLELLSNGPHGNRLQKAVSLDACFKVAQVSDFGARILRVFFDLACRDQPCFGREKLLCHFVSFELFGCGCLRLIKIF